MNSTDTVKKLIAENTGNSLTSKFFNWGINFLITLLKMGMMFTTFAVGLVYFK